MEQKSREDEKKVKDWLNDIRITAMEPPASLQDMRMVYYGLSPTNPGQVMYEQMKKTDPVAFDRSLKAAEKDYRVCLRDLEEKWGKDARGVEKVDGGYERLKKLMGEMLGADTNVSGA